MTLTDAQKQQLAKWVAEGAKLSDIQKRLSAEFGLSLTYMEARFLVDDLKLVPKDAATPPPEKLTVGVPPKPGATAPASEDTDLEEEALEPAEPAPPPGVGGGNVSVTVDTLARPGALVSGSVKFSDGQSATWYLDQMGRLGMAPQQQGYRPSAADLQSFQRALEKELTKLGL